MRPMTDRDVVERVAAQPSASRSVGLAGGAAVRTGSPAASGRHSLDSTPICDETGDDVDDCHCIDVRDYDERDEADERYQQALDERGRED
jgi:hypothetical protein